MRRDLARISPTHSQASFSSPSRSMMVSRIPTFSFKKGRIPRHLVLPSLLIAALTMGVIASSPWIGLSLLGLIYLSLIPYSWFSYHRQEARDRQTASQPSDVVPLRSVPTEH